MPPASPLGERVRIDTDSKLDFDDVLIRPKRSTLNSRKEVVLERTYRFIRSGREWTGIPIVASNMDTTGTFAMARALAEYKMLTCLHKFYTPDELAAFFGEFDNPDAVAYTTGMRAEDDAKLDAVLARGLGKHFNFLCLDAPNAHIERFVEKLRELREKCPEHTIIAGNCVTNEMTEELILQGADIVKIGIGPGSACTTRRQTGVGYPQLSAIIVCADAAHGITNKKPGVGLVMSDGGCVYPADVAKAFCGGADFVMSGSLFAGFDESGGELVERDGKQYKQYYGMSSGAAMQKHYGGVAAHRASEGRELLIPHKGSVHGFVKELLGSLRSTATYIGARRLKEFSRRATFLQVNRQLNTSLSVFSQ